jgi:peptidoglycan/LPS O-acetylase OafA/YrhL
MLPTRAKKHSIFARTLEFGPIKYLGLISYSFYLWHVPVIHLLDRYHLVFPETIWGLAGNGVLVLVVTVALSALTYHFVEERALRFKVRTGSTSADTEIIEPARRTPPTHVGSSHATESKSGESRVVDPRARG